MNDAVLTLRSVSKTYSQGARGHVEVLRGVDLDLARGEAVALVAPSGAGKSTLLHVAGLLDSPDQGDVLVLEKEMHTASDKRRTQMRREHIGFVYQFHHLLPEFSAIENVMLPQLANGATREAATKRAQYLLETLGLADRILHRPAALSGGEQQRVAIARALANKPRLLLADEPTGNLDPETADTVFAELMHLVKAEGLTALIATHNLELANRMDRVFRLEAGNLTAL